jgi:hypothetical protein
MSIFKPFETLWDQEILLVWDGKIVSDKTTVKAKSDKSFSKTWQQTFQFGFRFLATGIFPFYSYIIPDEIFTPSSKLCKRRRLLILQVICPKKAHQSQLHGYTIIYLVT